MKLDNRQSPWRKRLDRWVGIPLVITAALLRRLFFFYFRLKSQNPKKRILLIKLSALGDAVLLLPSLYRLKQTLKDSDIVFLGGSSNESFLKLCDEISEVRIFSLKTCLSLFGEKFDLVIDFDQWVRTTALVAATTRAAQISGYHSPNQHRHFAYDFTQRLDFKTHMAKNFWNLATLSLKKAGFNVSTTFETDKELVRREWAPKFLAYGKNFSFPIELKDPFVLIHPGCGEHGVLREWPIENWKEVVAFLTKRGLKVAISGKGMHEKLLSEKLQGPGVHLLVDRLKLHELIVILWKAQKVLVPNTGIMHLADFVNDFVVVLEGPTNPVIWGPLWRGNDKVSPVACSPCLTWGYDYGCSDPVCLKSVTPSKMIEGLNA